MAIKEKIDIVTIKKSSWMLWGNYKSNFCWAWIEFHDLKIYDSWDDIKNIDWLNTAKHNKVFTKKRIEEREMPALFVFDISRGMFFSSKNKTKLETWIKVFDILSNSLISSQDPYWYIFFDSAIRYFEKHKKWFLNSVLLKSRISKLKQASYLQERSDLSEMVRSLLKLKIRNNIIFIVTDNLIIDDTKSLTALSKLNDVIVMHISDDFENNLSSDWHIILSAFWNDFSVDLNDIKFKQKYILERKNELMTFKEMIIKCSWSCIFFSDTTDIRFELYNFFNLRNKIYK